jgi:hypothetical protein
VSPHPSTVGLSPRDLIALHRPLRKPEQVMLNAYRVVEGDISSRVVVARYRHLWDGALVWHITVMIRTPEGPPKDRVEWTRRDRKVALRTAERLIKRVGVGEVWGGAQAGMFEEATEHRLRRLGPHDEAHLPQGVDVPIIDLFPPLPEQEGPA